MPGELANKKSFFLLKAIEFFINMLIVYQTILLATLLIAALTVCPIDILAMDISLDTTMLDNYVRYRFFYATFVTHMISISLNR